LRYVFVFLDFLPTVVVSANVWARNHWHAQRPALAHQDDTTHLRPPPKRLSTPKPHRSASPVIPYSAHAVKSAV